MKKLSIITICRNEPNIERTCESIVAQTWQDFEWIVIDGASDDDTTLKIIEKYKDRIDYFLSEPDTGIYNAINKGIRRATGEFLNFMNAGDEFADKNVLKKVFGENTNYKGKDILYGNAFYVYPYKNNMVAPILFPNKINVNFFFNFYWNETYTINHQASFIRREILKIGYDENLKTASDYEFWLWAIKHKKVYHHLNFFCSRFYMDGAGCASPGKTLLEVQTSTTKIFTPKEIKKIKNNYRTFVRWRLFNFLEIFRKEANYLQDSFRYRILGIPVWSKVFKKNSVPAKQVPANTLLGQIRRLQKNNEAMKNNIIQKINVSENIAFPASFAHAFFNDYQGICAGRDLVIVGEGAALDDYEPIPDAVHIAFNRAFLSEKIKAEFLFLQDFRGDNHELAANYRGNACQKFHGFTNRAFYSEKSPAVKEPAHIYFFEEIFKTTPTSVPVLTDISCSTLTSFGYGAACALQFALWMHPRRIFIVGCDIFARGFSEELKKTVQGLAISPILRDHLEFGWQTLANFATKNYPDVPILTLDAREHRGIFQHISKLSEK